MATNKRERKKGVTIQIAAVVTGVSVNTLRNWDKKGILKPRREKNGYRYYDIKELQKFKDERRRAKDL